MTERRKRRPIYEFKGKRCLPISFHGDVASGGISPFNVNGMQTSRNTYYYLAQKSFWPSDLKAEESPWTSHPYKEVGKNRVLVVSKFYQARSVYGYWVIFIKRTKKPWSFFHVLASCNPTFERENL